MKSIFSMFRKEVWHVCWIAKIPGKEISYGDGSYDIKSKLTVESISFLRTKLSEETGKAAGVEVEPVQISITSLTRIA